MSENRYKENGHNCIIKTLVRRTSRGYESRVFVVHTSRLEIPKRISEYASYTDLEVREIGKTFSNGYTIRSKLQRLIKQGEYIVSVIQSSTCTLNKGGNQ
ncbi:MAG: hypothetical protein QW478_11285 [Candidatus Micrarchaeaceae archaeon]